MRALRAMSREAGVKLVEMDVPDIGNDDVLIRIMSAGLIPAAFHMFKMGVLKDLPQTLGHEGAGIVEAIGVNVDGLKPGDRVRIHPTMSCGRCRYCLTDRDQMCSRASVMGFVAFGRPVDDWARYHDGFIAEFARVPAAQVDKLPDNVSFDVGAKVHYFANALATLKAAALPRMANVAILGATGAMGAATIKMLPSFGVRRLILIGRSSERLAAAAARSAIPVDIISTEDLADDWFDRGDLARRMVELAPDGVDAMIDYLPNGGPLWQAIEGLSVSGTFVAMGGGPAVIPITALKLISKCWRVTGTRNNSRLDALEVIGMLETKRLIGDDIITHHHPLAEAEALVGMMIAGAREESRWLTVIRP